MTNAKAYIVAVVGVQAHEYQVLNRIFKLSAGRRHSYIMVADGGDQEADLVLLDNANSNLAAEREATKFGIGNAREIFITDSESADAAHAIRRPFMATRVLGALDRLVASIERLSPDPPNSTYRSNEASARSSSRPEPADSTSVTHTDSPMNSAQNIAQRMVEVEETRSVRSAAGSMNGAAAMDRNRVLVVDDSTTARNQLGKALRCANIDADLIDDGNQALNLIATKKYDMIFLDVVMPGMDGYEVCKSIKRNRAKKNTPVVMLTGKSSPFDRVKGKLSGCDDYLTKPVKFSDFKRTLEEFLKRPVIFENIRRTDPGSNANIQRQSNR